MLYPPYSRGTGIYINLGKTLVFHTRDEAARWAKDATGGQPGGVKKYPDQFWARKAADLGYDSVQITFGWMSIPECFITCPACRTQPRAIGACFPSGVDVRTGVNATLPCHCTEYDFDGRPTTALVNTTGGLANCDGNGQARAERGRRATLLDVGLGANGSLAGGLLRSYRSSESGKYSMMPGSRLDSALGRSAA
jgi:hypothetical protein